MKNTFLISNLMTSLAPSARAGHSQQVPAWGQAPAPCSASRDLSFARVYQVPAYGVDNNEDTTRFVGPSLSCIPLAGAQK